MKIYIAQILRMSSDTEYSVIDNILNEALSLSDNASMQEEKAKQLVLEKDFKTSTAAYLQAGYLNNKAAECYRQAAKLYEQIDTKTQLNSALLFEELGFRLDKEGDTENSLTAFKIAAEIYDQKKLKQKGNSCKIEIARHHASLCNYIEAAKIYEFLAADYLFENLNRDEGYRFLFSGALCRLAGGNVTTLHNHMNKYRLCDNKFTFTPEYKFLEKLINIITTKNIDDFSQLVREFDSLHKLDTWQVTLLLRIKNSIY